MGFLLLEGISIDPPQTQSSKQSRALQRNTSLHTGDIEGPGRRSSSLISVFAGASKGGMMVGRITDPGAQSGITGGSRNRSPTLGRLLLKGTL